MFGSSQPITQASREGSKPSRAIPFWLYVLSTIVLLALLLGFIVGTSLLLGWASVNVPAQVLDVDVMIYRALATIDNPGLISIVFTLFNDPGLDYTLVIAACLGYVWWRRRKDIVAAVAAVAMTLVVGAWTIPYTHWFGLRARPFTIVPEVMISEQWRQIWTYNPTFPSGHLRELAGLCLVLAYFWPRARPFALIYLVFLGFTRLFIGAHFPTDVLAGMFIGLSVGTFTILTVTRVGRITFTLAQKIGLRSAYDYIFRPRALDKHEADPIPAKALRLALPFGLLVATAFITGSAIHTETPRILGDYLRNTDNSLVYPVFGRFDPSRADLIYWFFADASKSFPSLAVLILGYSAFRGWKRLARALLAVVVMFVLVEVIVVLVSPYFGRPSPFTTGEVSLPEIWKARWHVLAFFPDRYLLTVMALSSLLARLWARSSVAAYLYPLLVLASLLYFGAAWPTDGLATLVVGFLVARYSLFASGQFMPRGWRLRDDHGQGAGDNAAGNRGGGDGLAVSMGG